MYEANLSLVTLFIGTIIWGVGQGSSVLSKVLSVLILGKTTHKNGLHFGHCLYSMGRHLEHWQANEWCLDYSLIRSKPKGDTLFRVADA